MRSLIARARRALPYLLAAATALIAALLICECVDAYKTGMSPENFTETGARLRDLFTRADAVKRLTDISWSFYLWGAIFLLTLGVKQPPRKLSPARLKDAPAIAIKPRTLWIARAALLVCAALLIFAGVLNGGMNDVLVKAIRICTECIGLG